MTLIFCPEVTWKYCLERVMCLLRISPRFFSTTTFCFKKNKELNIKLGTSSGVGQLRLDIYKTCPFWKNCLVYILIQNTERKEAFTLMAWLLRPSHKRHCYFSLSWITGEANCYITSVCVCVGGGWGGWLGGNFFRVRGKCHDILVEFGI